jgi:acyl-CoA thioesterase-2
MRQKSNMKQDPMSLIALAPTPLGALEGRCIEGAIGRIFGGQTVAQVLRAGSIALGIDHAPNSIHAYFVAPGVSRESVIYKPQVIKQGRSIDIVSVEAHQADRLILTAIISFHRPEASLEFQRKMPGATAPEHLPPSDFAPPGTNLLVRAPFDLRYVNDAKSLDESGLKSEKLVWVRTRDRVDSDREADHAALLAYASDFLVTRAMHEELKQEGGKIFGASIDHSMWFHRPFRVDEWLLVENEGLSFSSGRAFSRSHIFDRRGDLVASVTQEAILRPKTRDMPTLPLRPDKQG